MNKKIICYIQAFACEDTVAATMRSILEQTYENWICFVLSNGNEKVTGNSCINNSFDVIKAAAAKDSRFIVINKRLNDLDMYIQYIYHLSQMYPGSYICSLDSDDEYESDFFERAAAFAEENRLDIVAGGTSIYLKEAVDSEDKTLLSKRQLNEDLIVESKNFAGDFIRYKPFFNEMWGKLYSTNLFQGKGKFNKSHCYKKFFGRFLPDSLFTIDTLSNCKRIGVLSGTSHRFYHFVKRPAYNATQIANAAVACRQDSFNMLTLRKILYNQVFSVYNTYDAFMAFLGSFGEISDELYEYMQAVLFGWFNDFYQRNFLEAQKTKLLAKRVGEFVFNDKFDEVIKYKAGDKYGNLRNFIERKRFVDMMYSFILAQEKVDNGWYTSSVKSKIRKIAAKLKDTSEALSKLQLEGAQRK
ncbi:MAG: glycosyltransferase family 2 protein [Chitinispirillia bacterium]|nr:glycosyltransferase family 2 protein [Chitinispirillia bacterium]MCL2268433.1 glycosyltransferase family 2 protein [Chitinispirillia bacterium]